MNPVIFASLFFILAILAAFGLFSLLDLLRGKRRMAPNVKADESWVLPPDGPNPEPPNAEQDVRPLEETADWLDLPKPIELPPPENILTVFSPPTPRKRRAKQPPKKRSPKRRSAND